MNKSIFVALGIAGLMIAACSKKDDKALTSVELATSATWKIDTIGLDMNNDGTIDSALPFPLESCDMDNTISFSKDSSGVFSYGSSKCDSGEPDNEPFNWYFKDNDKTVFFDGDLPGELNGDVKLVTLTNSAFVMSKEVTFTSPITYTTHLIIALKK